MTKKILFQDTSFRDGFQSIFGARAFTKDFIPAVEAAVAAGITHFEAGGGARFQAPFLYCGESAFDMMDAFRKAVGPDVRLQTLARGINVVALEQQPADMIDLHAKMFKKHGMTRIRNFDALNDVNNLIYSGQCIVDAGLEHEVVVTMMELPRGCSGAHDAEFYANTLRQILDAGVPFSSVCFKDASGTSNPRKVHETFKAARKLLGDKVELRIHSHETCGTGISQYLAAIEAGCDGAELIAALADTGSVLEFGKGHTHAVTALGKMAGRTVAFIYTGKGDTCDNRMKKIARFVRFADCYNIPVVSLVDSTGLKLFDTVERQMAVLNAASALVYAYSEATTVKVTLVIGNAIGSAYVAMGGSANADMTYAWPGSVISPMTGEAAIQIMWKDKIMASKGDAVKAREELAAQYEAEVADGVNAAVEGLVDDVIEPAMTRQMIAAALEMLAGKRDSKPAKKHGNMPL